VEELALGDTPARRVRPALPARAYRLGPEPSPAPVAAIVILGVGATRREPEHNPLTGADKLTAIMGARWHSRLGDPLGRSAAQFRIATGLAAVTACTHVIRPRSGAPPTRLAELVEELVA
jgi:hypothetical protein